MTRSYGVIRSFGVCRNCFKMPPISL
ncbi:hypothetical protein KVK89_05625 [Helicobacter pylori]|nr:hypothetical protein KVK89_05625 [Helicobacter pylori]WQZ46469.1 hypothetical protein E5P89_01165 [Helicobacter pylori]